MDSFESLPQKSAWIYKFSYIIAGDLLVSSKKPVTQAYKITHLCYARGGRGTALGTNYVARRGAVTVSYLLSSF